MEAQETANARRHDIDWLRVILFALLIWFHYAVFSLWQLEGSSGGMEAFNLVLFFVLAVMHQWRLGAMFFISRGGDGIRIPKAKLEGVLTRGPSGWASRCSSASTYCGSGCSIR